MISLKGYGSSSDDSESESENENPKEEKSVFVSNISTVALNSAPEVVSTNLDNRRHVNSNSKMIHYNPKYEELYAAIVGPVNPHKSEQEAAAKNMLSGYVESAHVNAFHFESQRRTFHSYGYAIDPSVEASDEIVSNREISSDLKTVFESGKKKRPLDDRKRDRNADPTDIEGFLGPWAKYADEETVSKPNEEDAAYLEDYLSKRQKRAKEASVDDKPVEEKSTLHIKDPYDYQGRSYLHIPQDVGTNLKTEEAPEKCFLPKRQIHAWTGHSKGVTVLKWFPKSAHLLLSGSMDNRIKLWEVYKNRRCVRTFNGHKSAIKDLSFSNNGSQFLSTSYDRFIKLWDTETGECVNRFSNRKIAYCVKFNPDENKQHLFVAGTADKKIVCWDARSGHIVQEYDRHLGAVNTVTFIDNNRRMVSTSDDKSLRVWEWGIPVDMKYIADPSMHSIPAVAKSPNHKWLAGQSLDNKISIFSCGERFRPHKKKEFKGHMAAGYACGMDFSPEMSYLISGDGDGKCCVWDWKTTKMVSKWKAHENACIDVLWHPHETSKVATAGWDGLIKYWD